MTDIGTEAKSLAQMVIEWVDGGIDIGTDWRPGLEAVIAARLTRLRTGNAAKKHPDNCECGECWQAMEAGSAV